jgi:hypothetical protein
VVEHVEQAHGAWREGDLLFLTTDALAAWFLGGVERETAPWRDLNTLAAADGGAFARWADGERAGGRLRNDDLTLVRVEVGPR